MLFLAEDGPRLPKKIALSSYQVGFDDVKHK